MNRLTLTLALMLGACVSAPIAPLVDPVPPQLSRGQVPYIATLPPTAFFCFSMNTGTKLGRGFVAQGNMFTATHVVSDDFVDGDHDVTNLGPSPIAGSDISFTRLSVGDMIYYWTPDRGNVAMMITGVEADEYVIYSQKPVIPGDSGSPVMNSHGDVVAVVSRTFRYQNGSFGGIMEMILPTDLPEEQ